MSPRQGCPATPLRSKWREDAFQVFTASGLPHRRIEAWHYTDLRALYARCLAGRDSPWRRGASALCARNSRLRVNGGAASCPCPMASSRRNVEWFAEGIKVSSLGLVLTEGRPDLIALLSSQDLAKDLGAREIDRRIERGFDAGRRCDRGGAWNRARRARSSHSCHGFARARRAFLRSALIICAGASIRLAESCHAAHHAGTVPTAQAKPV